MAGGWLALDTATNVASVAAERPEGPTAVVVERGARRQAAEIVGLIDRALREADLGLGDLAGIIVSDGPGSFTGLRISWAAAKGLAHERGIPLFAAPSLLGAAFSAWGATGAVPGTTVAACYDALRGQVFAGVYRFSAGAVTTLVVPAVMTVAELGRVAPERPRVAVGDGACRYADEVYVWTGHPPLETPSGPPLHPVAAALLALRGWHGAVALVSDRATREPAYGRPAEAQVRWETRHGRPLPDPTSSPR
jgi:tRNA threonylcarbamoyladenosine biosynthesis protein TsaB